MRIYYALTTYHILCCVLHNLNQKDNEKSVLLLSDIHKNSVSFLNRYQEIGIFDEIYLLDELKVNDTVKSLARRKMPLSIRLSTANKMIAKRLPIKISAKDELFLCPDHFPFGWYIVSSKRNYNCFEEGCGVLSDRTFALSNMERNTTQRTLYDKLKLFGENDYAKKIFADKSAQQPDYKNDKMVDFSVVSILNSLEENELDKVLSFFGCKREEVKSPAGLILTQHLANLGLMSLKNQHRLYALFADIFLENQQVVIKPHPDDIAGCYEDVFDKKATVLPFAMPSELLSFCVNLKFEKAVAAYSTAVRSLGDGTKSAVSFDDRILKDYIYLCKYLVVSRLLEKIAQSETTIATNANELLLDELCEHKYNYVRDDENNANCYIISDKYKVFDDDFEDIIYDEKEDINAVKNILNKEKATVIFLNEKGNHLHFDGENYDVFQRIRPICLNYSDGTTQTIFVYSSDKKILDEVNDFTMKKELKYTGLTVDIDGISKAESEKIRVLEGMLEATQARLNAYIKNARKEQEK